MGNMEENKKKLMGNYKRITGEFFFPKQDGSETKKFLQKIKKKTKNFGWKNSGFLTKRKIKNFFQVKKNFAQNEKKRKIFKNFVSNSIFET